MLMMVLTRPAVITDAEAFGVDDSTARYHLEETADEVSLIIDGEKLVEAKALSLVGRATTGAMRWHRLVL